MSEQFEYDPYFTSQTAVAETDAQKDTWFTHRVRAAVAAGGMVLATVGATLATIEPVEAGGFRDETYSSSASFSEKAQDVEATGHRGLEGYYNGRKADEDTIRSCLHAVAAGANACEIDLRIPKHAAGRAIKPIVMHDATTNRVTRDCNLEIATHTYRRLKNCHMNHGDTVSSLEGLASALSPYRNRVDIIAEIKDKYVSTKELRAINSTFARYGFGATNLAYESFYGKHLRNMKQVAPDVKALLIKGSTSNPMRASSLSSAFDGIIIPYQAFVNGERANSNFAEEYRAQNREIIPWGVETIDQMRYVIANGASGFMSDHVNRVNSLR
jgi:glycerophosphoryl diester phosphodiesterase